jgi:hypothetical protein
VNKLDYSILAVPVARATLPSHDPGEAQERLRYLEAASR